MINIDIQESVKCNSDYSLFVTFDYKYELVEIIRTITPREYDRDTKTWEIPLNKLGEVANKLSDYDVTITGQYIRLKDENEQVKLPANFKFKTTPYEHQIEGVKYGLSHNKWLLGDEQGLGKTKQVIDIARARNVKHCLIICCVNGLKWNWKEEVEKHSYDGSWILGQRTNRNNRVVIDGNAERLADLTNINDMPRFIITNIETLRYKVKTGRKICIRKKGRMVEEDEYVYPITQRLQELCASGEIEMIAVDEFHKCKNPDASQTEQLLKLHTTIQIAMTGTPLMNAPIDIYPILNWLGYERHTFWQFKSHYGRLGGFNGTQVIGYKNLEEIEDVLDKMMLRRLKDKVLDLPEKIFITDYVEMGKAQADVYDNIRSYMIDHIGELKMANNPLAELIRLRQATGNPNIISDVKENAKFDRMEEIVDDAIENGRKVVIFSNWTNITNPAYDRLSKKYKCLMITGNIKEEQRQINKNQFQNDENVKCIIGTIGAMGTGYTLTAGSIVIFLDEPWNKALKDQALDRLHRIGLKDNMTVYTLLCKGTIDERVNDIVERKGQMAEILIDGKTNGDTNALINFLLS